MDDARQAAIERLINLLRMMQSSGCVDGETLVGLFAPGSPQTQASELAVDWLIRKCFELNIYSTMALAGRHPSRHPRREDYIVVMGEAMGEVFDQTSETRKVVGAAFAAAAASAEVRHE